MGSDAQAVLHLLAGDERHGLGEYNGAFNKNQDEGADILVILNDEGSLVHSGGGFNNYKDISSLGSDHSEDLMPNPEAAYLNSGSESWANMVKEEVMRKKKEVRANIKEVCTHWLQSVVSLRPGAPLVSFDDRRLENYADSFHSEPDVICLSVTEAVRLVKTHSLVQLRQENGQPQVVKQPRAK